MSPQRPQMRPRRGPLPRLSPPKKRLVALVLAVALGLTFTGFALGQGLGGGSLSAPQDPTDPVAEVDGVDNGAITLQEFEQSVEQVAKQQGLKETPGPDDPSYEQLRDQAISNLLLPIWILGEGKSKGIEPSDEEIDERLSEIKDQGFENDKEFRRFVERQGFCTEEELAEGDPAQCERVRREVRVQVIAEELQSSVLPADQEAALSDVPRSDVEAFYDQNIAQYQTPETRDVRLIQTNKAEQAQEAHAALQQDDSNKNWKQVAKQYSQDAASKDRGGLLEGVVEGQSPGGPQFDERVFAAPEGELVAPFETDNGFYVFQVQKVNPAETTPLSDVEQQIRQQLAATEQQAVAQDFEQDFFAKWKQRTVCAEGYITDDCRNFTPPDPCPAEQAEAGTCPPPVVSTRPVAPGQAGLLTAAGATRAPQGPYQPAPEAPPGLPGGGTIPIGPDGAPQVPGAVPPGAAPPGAAPPGAPPPGAVPPGGAPPGGAPPPPPPPAP